MTPERKAQISAMRYPKPQPPPAMRKAVTRDGTNVRDAVVREAPRDPNAGENDRVVEVRRDDWVVTIDQYAAEHQRDWEEWEAEHDKQLYETSCRQHIWTDPNDY